MTKCCSSAAADTGPSMVLVHGFPRVLEEEPE